MLAVCWLGVPTDEGCNIAVLATTDDLGTVTAMFASGWLAPDQDPDVVLNASGWGRTEAWETLPQGARIATVMSLGSTS